MQHYLTENYFTQGKIGLVNAEKMYEGVEVLLHLFLTSAMDGYLAGSFTLGIPPPVPTEQRCLDPIPRSFPAGNGEQN